MDKAKKMPASMQAKKDVLEALRKMAMEMMSQDVDMGEDPGAVVAKVDVKKVEPMSEDVEMDDMEDSEDEEMEDTDLDPEMEEKMMRLLKKKKSLV